MNWRARRRAEGFNLAFLDIMSCGLGAILLIFMLVKYQTDAPGGSVESGKLRAQLAAIQNEISVIESTNAALAAQLENLKRELQRETQRAVQTGKQSEAAAAELIALSKEIARLQQQLEQQRQAAQTEQTTPEPVDDKLEQDHLIGLRVDGARILILLDTSASMAEERLVDIIKIKASGIAAKKAAPKWRRALAITQWIIDRVPEKSQYAVMHYSDKADFLSGVKWQKAGDAKARTEALVAMDKLYPQGATNLHAALKLVTSSGISPTDLYVITDSLPTKGRDSLSAVQRSKACGLFSSKATTVSGECRSALFYAAIKSFSSHSARVNAVLLPIEGDPEAGYAYWLWAATTTGTMISPAGSWP